MRDLWNYLDWAPLASSLDIPRTEPRWCYVCGDSVCPSEVISLGMPGFLLSVLKHLHPWLWGSCLCCFIYPPLSLCLPVWISLPLKLSPFLSSNFYTCCSLCLPPSQIAPFLNHVGVQNKSPQDMPQWCMDCFELKTTKILWAQEKLLLPLKYLKEFELEVLPIIIDYQR